MDQQVEAARKEVETTKRDVVEAKAEAATIQQGKQGTSEGSQEQQIASANWEVAHRTLKTAQLLHHSAVELVAAGRASHSAEVLIARLFA
eukprot:CAMPEP_0175874494 /NCGR_PEP_ID=MMETSP0107_2-20121207/38921_1 /TAXON_ID=195067 ORGANISM="Goniomonas pacifica, Strain CCMP1869" /NCGR_SAMPLE_ID=MMETSP0107_2 /ASSEMBLY_ACC=CAM_ASM_000203 /LENGTH=89 /DNA_ID=CAMNT_0017193389 /DNA_START=503 /DNA_END=769 /DNA_ORIENTATION=+